MNRSRAQHNRLRFGGRAIGLVLVLALLSLQQAWAAVSCLSDDESGMQAAMMSCEHHKAAPAANHSGYQHGASAETPHGCMHHNSSPASRSATEPERFSEYDRQPTGGQPCGLSCCQVQPQPDVPVASFSFQQQVPEAPETPLQMSTTVADVLPVASLPKPPRSRPVYLTVSAFLI